MDAEGLCVAVARALPDGFECSRAPREGIRVRTPLTYPDGGLVDVFVLEQGEGYRITDFGETLGWLRMQSKSDHRSPEEQRTIETTSEALGVTLRRGQLEVEAMGIDAVGQAVRRLAETAVQVAHEGITLASEAEGDVRRDGANTTS